MWLRKEPSIFNCLITYSYWLKRRIALSYLLTPFSMTALYWMKFLAPTKNCNNSKSWAPFYSIIVSGKDYILLLKTFPLSHIFIVSLEYSMKSRGIGE